MSAYYNEIDGFAAQWLRNLIRAGLIAAGDVDTRSIAEVHADDVRGYLHCHFFAGLGGWPYALRLAGWPEDRPVWTGSCPCQPFSHAGKQRGSEDERHLWPAFFDLIRQRRPATVFGEQVAGSAGYAWLDHVAADLEAEGYAVAAADLGAHSVGAPHIRQRLYWVADTGITRREGETRDALLLAQRAKLEHDPHGRGEICRVGDADGARLEGRCDNSGEHAGQLAAGTPGPWSDLQWLRCADDKARPTKPGVFPLADGVPGRVGRLRAYGNAIVPQVAAEFIGAFMHCRP